MACYLHQPLRDSFTVLYFNGNGELAADRSEQSADMFLDMGVNVCFVEYRGYGKSTGRPELARMLSDGMQVMRALQLEPQKTIALGRSLGSIYAIELASRCPKLAGLILESPIANILELAPLLRATSLGRWIAGKMIRYTPFNHQAKIERYRGPMLTMHCMLDGLIPVTHSMRLCDWKKESNKTIRLFEHGHHNSIHVENEAVYNQQVASFIQSI